MKKTYLKPAMQTVCLQQHLQLLAGTITDVNTNLSEEDDLEIDENPQSSWGR